MCNAVFFTDYLVDTDNIIIITMTLFADAFPITPESFYICETF